MNQTTTQKLKQKLEQISARVRGDATAMLDQARAGSGGQGDGGLSNAPMHLGDMGTDEFLYDMNTTLLENEQFIATETSEALRRIDAGTFGACENCSRPIATARLEEIPFARLCVRCAANDNNTPQVNLNDGRPMHPRDTLAPEGEMNEDRLPQIDPLESPHAKERRGDIHAAGTAGGGTAVGGLAGSNEGNGDPVIAEIDEATASSNFDRDDDYTDDRTPRSGPSGGAVGGTPARKRSV